MEKGRRLLRESAGRMESLPIGGPEEKKKLLEETTVRYGWCLFALEEWEILQSELQPLAEAGAKNPELLYLLGEAWKGRETPSRRFAG